MEQEILLRLQGETDWKYNKYLNFCQKPYSPYFCSGGIGKAQSFPFEMKNCVCQEKMKIKRLLPFCLVPTF